MTKLFDRSDRGKLWVDGPQARWFLNQLLSADIDQLAQEQGCEALMLDAHGKILFAVRVFAVAGGFLVDTDPGARDGFAELLNSRVFTTDVRIETVEVSQLTVVGERVAETVNDVLQRMYVPEDDLGICQYGNGWIAKVGRPIEGLELFVKEEFSDLKSRLIGRGFGEGSADEWASLNITAGVPTLGSQFDSTFLPQEAALENAISFSKGCYPGQEAVAMAQRGRVKRRLRHLVFTDAGASGDVSFQDAVVGQVGEDSLSGGYAIAAIKTSVPVGAMVSVGDACIAEVRDLPGTQEAEKPPSARELRESLKGVPARPR